MGWSNERGDRQTGRERNKESGREVGWRRKRERRQIGRGRDKMRGRESEDGERMKDRGRWG